MAIKMVSISLKSESNSDSDSENFGNDLGNHIVAIRYIVWRNRTFFATLRHIITIYLGAISHFLPHYAIL